MGRLETYLADIHAPIETVFDLVDDPDHLKLWMDGLESTTYTSARDPDNPVGATFVQRIREGGRVAEYAGEVVAYDKPRHLATTIGSGRFAMRVDYRLESTASGTRLNYAAEMIRGGWVARVFAVLFGWLTRRILKRQMTKLRAVAEARESSAN